MNLRPTKCKNSGLLTFFPRSHNPLSATHSRHSESSSSSSSASGPAPAPVSAPAAVPIMTGPPTLEVVHDEEVPAAELPANESSDEDEAAVDGEVVLAAGAVGFDAGPLVLDRNIPERDEVHRVLGMIQIHISRDVQNTIIDNLWGLLCFMTYAPVAGSEDDLDGVGQFWQANLDFTPSSTNWTTSWPSRRSTSRSSCTTLRIVVKMLLIEMIALFNYQMHNPYHNPIKFLDPHQYPPMHANNIGPLPNSLNTRYFPHMVHLGIYNARGNWPWRPCTLQPLREDGSQVR